MDKLKALIKKLKITKGDIWGFLLIIFLVLNIWFFLWGVATGGNRCYVLNYVATVVCSFSLGTWLGSY